MTDGPDPSGDGPERPEEGPGDSERPDLGDLFEELSELEDAVDSHAEREQVRETMRMAMSVEPSGGVFGRVVYGFGAEDVAEAFLGALLFGIPMAVEGGTAEVAAVFATNPALFVVNLAATVVVVLGILYVADFQDVRVYEPFFGLVPRRVVGVLVAAAVTSLGLLTVWGRVAWSTASLEANWLAVCTCSVALFPMAIGAALGDILPGS